MNFAAQKAIYDRDIQAIEPEMPFVFYDRGRSITAQRQEIMDTLLGGDAGYEQQYDFEIIVRFTAYSGINLTPPKTEDAIEIDDPNSATGVKPRKTLRIKSVKPSQDGVTWTWGVKADN